VKFDLGHKENFPNIGAQLMDDGEVLLTFQSHPASAMMAVPLNVAVDFAKHILDLQKQGEDAATEPNLQQSRRFTDQVTDDDFLHMIDESNFAQERE